MAVAYASSLDSKPKVMTLFSPTPFSLLTFVLVNNSTKTYTGERQLSAIHLYHSSIPGALAAYNIFTAVGPRRHSAQADSGQICFHC
jgi:hypothetical protein